MKIINYNSITGQCWLHHSSGVVDMGKISVADAHRAAWLHNARFYQDRKFVFDSSAGGRLGEAKVSPRCV